MDKKYWILYLTAYTKPVLSSPTKQIRYTTFLYNTKYFILHVVTFSSTIHATGIVAFSLLQFFANAPECCFIYTLSFLLYLIQVVS
jgi:hypothetical protein